MKVKRGDIVISDFGQGKIIAITRQWVIHEDEKTGEEYALSRDDEWISVPAELPKEDLPKDISIDI